MNDDRIFLFDIGNVMLDFCPLGLQQAIVGASRIGLTDLQARWNRGPFIDTETGRLGSRAFHRALCREIGLTWTFDQWLRAWADIFSINPFGRGRYLDLQRQGRRVGVLSNLASYHMTAIKLNHPDFFDVPGPYYFSFDLGLHKPDPEIYRAVCEDLGLAPDRVVFVDDLEANVQGACSIGIHAVQLRKDNHREVSAFIESFL